MLLTWKTFPFLTVSGCLGVAWALLGTIPTAHAAITPTSFSTWGYLNGTEVPMHSLTVPGTETQESMRTFAGLQGRADNVTRYRLTTDWNPTQFFVRAEISLSTSIVTEFEPSFDSEWGFGGRYDWRAEFDVDQPTSVVLELASLPTPPAFWNTFENYMSSLQSNVLTVVRVDQSGNPIPGTGLNVGPTPVNATLAPGRYRVSNRESHNHSASWGYPPDNAFIASDRLLTITTIPAPGSVMLLAICGSAIGMRRRT